MNRTSGSTTLFRSTLFEHWTQFKEFYIYEKVVERRLNVIKKYSEGLLEDYSETGCGEDEGENTRTSQEWIDEEWLIL